MRLLRFLCFASLLAAGLLWIGGDNLAAETSDPGKILAVSETAKPPSDSASITITITIVGGPEGG